MLQFVVAPVVIKAIHFRIAVAQTQRNCAILHLAAKIQNVQLKMVYRPAHVYPDIREVH